MTDDYVEKRLREYKQKAAHYASRAEAIETGKFQGRKFWMCMPPFKVDDSISGCPVVSILDYDPKYASPADNWILVEEVKK